MLLYSSDVLAGTTNKTTSDPTRKKPWENWDTCLSHSSSQCNPLAQHIRGVGDLRVVALLPGLLPLLALRRHSVVASVAAPQHCYPTGQHLLSPKPLPGGPGLPGKASVRHVLPPTTAGEVIANKYDLDAIFISAFLRSRSTALPLRRST